jgi:AraC-like DNA-binding protein
MEELARLKDLILHNARGTRTWTELAGVSVLCSPTTTEPQGDVTEPTVAVIAQGGKETHLNGRTFAYGPGQFVITSLELPVTGHIVRASAEEPFLAFVLKLRPEMIAALLLETAPPAALRPAGVEASPAGIAVSDASRPLLDSVCRLLALLDAPSDAAALASGVEREILWRLITGPQGATVRQIGLADSRLALLGRAIRWIRSHYDQTLRVEELAELANMSTSSFHRHFRAVTSMTPIQFQKQLRLHQARTRLLTDPSDVAGVGFAVGYESPSQFSREYRRMFGVPPSQDVVALSEAASRTSLLAQAKP